MRLAAGTEQIMNALSSQVLVPPKPSRSAKAELETTLLAEALEHRAVNHPYLKALASGELPDVAWALRDFAMHYYGYSAHFPRYLTAAISRLEDPRHRRALMENLTEESGHYSPEEYVELQASGIEREWIAGVPHPMLFARFREALGLRGEIGIDGAEVTCWREMFYSVLATGSPAEAIGALGLGTEAIVSFIYQYFVRAIGHTDVSARDSVFFALHCDVDDHHHETLLQIARDLCRDERSREDLARGMRKALFLRASFWDYLHGRALAAPRCNLS